jgi:radical SAM-linked protein
MPEQRQTLIADFAMQGRLVYLSHQETLTLLGRALLRAGAPVVFSGGFNPRPRISIPLPRSVGTQSVAERCCAVLTSEEAVNCEALGSRLDAQLPEGCTLQDVRCVEGKRTFHPCGVRYEFILAELLAPSLQDHLSVCRHALEAGQPVVVQRYRTKKKTHEPFNISGFVQSLCFLENRIVVSCRVSREGSVRIDELMQWLHLEISDLGEPAKRTEIEWEHEIQEQN